MTFSGAFRANRFLALFATVGMLTALATPASAAIADAAISFSATDDGPPSPFAATDTQALGGLTGQYLGTLRLSGTLTDGGTNGVSATTFTFPTTLARGFINNVPVLDVGPEAFVAGLYGPYEISKIINATDFGGSLTSMSARTAFTGSGGDDAYAFSVVFELNAVPVPVPSAAGMGLVVLGGMAGVGAWRQRRN